ncbi:MAG: recombinase family protein [Lachnospiraceae bacterium]|nr:recombinase family protein [Ruminococcus sp.]MCM1275355.1 recombinase family protein [Lachnospiraceae bacterium]
MDKKDIIRAALYARFSSNLQHESSIEAQKYAIDKYAAEKGIVVTQEYIDRACTGTTTDGRAQLTQLVEDCSKGLFEVVLIHKMDRLARNLRDMVNLLDEMEAAGVEVIFVAEPFINGLDSNLFRNILAAFNEYFSENLGKEVLKGFKERARNGLHTGGIPPLGYDVDVVTKKLVINEKEAQAVRKIFDMYIKGASLTEIVNDLNQSGYVTKVGKAFGKSSLHEIIRNKKYCGYYVYNRREPLKRCKGKRGKGNSHRDKPKDEIIEVKDGVPAIVSEEVFNRAQEISKSHEIKSGAYSAKQAYLLSGLVKCGHCGCNMTGDRHHSGKGIITVSYSCERRKKNKSCPNMSIRQDKLDALVIDKICDYIFKDENIPIITTKLLELEQSRNSEYQNCVKRITKRIQSNCTKRENLVNAIAKGCDVSTVRDKLNALEDEKTALERSLQEAKEKFRCAEITKESVLKLRGRFKEYMLTHNTVAVRALIKKFVVSVTENNNEVEIILNI